MRFSAALLLGAAGLAAAQSSTSAAAPATASSSKSGCGEAIDQIIDACLKSTTPQVDACATNDWNCMCKNQQAVVTCYNNCPSDPNAFGAKQQLTSWCNAAKAYPQSSSAASNQPTGKSNNSSAAQQTPSSTTTANNGPHTGFASASSSGSATPSVDPNSGASGLAPASGLLAAIFGLALL